MDSGSISLAVSQRQSRWPMTGRIGPGVTLLPVLPSPRMGYAGLRWVTVGYTSHATDNADIRPLTSRRTSSVTHVTLPADGLHGLQWVTRVTVSVPSMSGRESFSDNY